MKGYKPQNCRWRKLANRNAKTYLPNASTIGYGKYRAESGDFVSFTVAPDDVRYGRVVGRVAETAEDGLEDCAGFLEVVMLGSTLDFAARNWVDPKDVTYCTGPERAHTFLTKFFTASVDSLERYAETNDSRDFKGE
jgi:hypothetical protein